MFNKDVDTSLITIHTDEGNIDFETWLSQNDVISDTDWKSINCGKEAVRIKLFDFLENFERQQALAIQLPDNNSGKIIYHGLLSELPVSYNVYHVVPLSVRFVNDVMCIEVYSDQCFDDGRWYLKYKNRHN